MGAGVPVVLLHGARASRTMWRPQLDALSDVYTVVAWDAPPTAVARSLGKEASR